MDVTVGACAAGDTTGMQQRTDIRHSSVDGIGAKEIVIGTEELKAARLTVDTDVLSPGCEDKEYMIYRLGPALDLLGMRDFILNGCVRQTCTWIRRSIYPQ